MTNETKFNTINKEINKNRRSTIFALAAVVLITVFSSIVTEFKYVEALTGIPNAIGWMVQNLYPTAETMQNLPNILQKLVETVFSAVAASTCASIIAYGFALVGSDATGFNNGLSATIRFIASIFRNVPDVVWSMIFLFTFGQNIFTGFLALFFVTIGMLTRAFIEVIDQTAGESVEAVQATAGNRLEVIGQAIFPDSIAGVISWILYSIENNIRSATLIGILTGSGIGYIFDIYYKNFDYASCALVIICISLVVLLVQGISSIVRRSVL